MMTVDLREIVLTKGDVSIGAAIYPDRKRPAIIVQRGNSASVYGYFKSVECARLFVDELAKLVGAKNEIREAKNCRYYTPNCFWGGAGCLGTKEIDPCKGDGCERWKAKEDAE